MKPRFLIRHATSEIKQILLSDLGYQTMESVWPEDIMVIGNDIVKMPPVELNTIHKVLDGKDVAEVRAQAELQKQWMACSRFEEFNVGHKDKGKVLVSKVGVMIDRFIIPIELFQQLNQSVRAIKSPFIATHEPVINKSLPFMTIGCDDYSLNDLDRILAAHEKLTNNGQEQKA